MNDEAVYRTAPATPGLLKIGQSGGAGRWRVCYQRGLSRLVFFSFFLIYSMIFLLRKKDPLVATHTLE